ncbi:MAG: NAD kinase [Flavobacteriales bacterium TMED123]|nr:MAG: NAD kinase [Flavobacteriales bacterium TMED123]|tara:strand:+ start:5378 stop:6256 length:879 start_codon:yes stop_codon:yes gene_type:complete
MHIALFGTPCSEQFTKYIQHLVSRLEAENVSVLVYEEYFNFLENKIEFKKHPIIFDSYEGLKDQADYLFSIGGDGTLLGSVTLVRDSNIPILGINTGRLGFISSIATDQIESAITDVLNNNFEIKSRTLLSLKTENNLFGKVNFALNEVAVVKKDTSSMIRIDAFLDDEFLNSYWADGIVIATPTGSTGYSLSCGGPIIIPGNDNVIVTPIAPHNLNVRPIVLSDKNSIKLKVADKDQLALVSLDSRFRAFDSSISLLIKKADFKINLIEPQSHSFISTIRTKLMWGIDKRN